MTYNQDSNTPVKFVYLSFLYTCNNAKFIATYFRVVTAGLGNKI